MFHFQNYFDITRGYFLLVPICPNQYFQVTHPITSRVQPSVPRVPRRGRHHHRALQLRRRGKVSDGQAPGGHEAGSEVRHLGDGSYCQRWENIWKNVVNLLLVMVNVNGY